MRLSVPGRYMNMHAPHHVHRLLYLTYHRYQLIEPFARTRSVANDRMTYKA